MTVPLFSECLLHISIYPPHTQVWVQRRPTPPPSPLTPISLTADNTLLKPGVVWAGVKIAQSMQYSWTFFPFFVFFQSKILYSVFFCVYYYYYYIFSLAFNLFVPCRHSTICGLFIFYLLSLLRSQHSHIFTWPFVCIPVVLFFYILTRNK